VKTERHAVTCGRRYASSWPTSVGRLVDGRLQILLSKSLLFLLFLKYLSKSGLQDFQGFSTLAQWAGTHISGMGQIKRKVPTQWT
jgi:hypothetical protein